MGNKNFFFYFFFPSLWTLVSPEPNESGLLKVECGQNGLSAAPTQHTTLLPSVTTIPPIRRPYWENTTDKQTNIEGILVGNTI